MNKKYQRFNITDNKREKIESWFDEHERPFDIERHVIKTSMVKIEVFCAWSIEDSYMIKLTCNNARYAKKLSDQTYLISESIGLEQILWNKKLFFLR